MINVNLKWLEARFTQYVTDYNTYIKSTNMDDLMGLSKEANYIRTQITNAMNENLDFPNVLTSLLNWQNQLNRMQNQLNNVINIRTQQLQQGRGQGNAPQNAQPIQPNGPQQGQGNVPQNNQPSPLPPRQPNGPQQGQGNNQPAPQQQGQGNSRLQNFSNRATQINNNIKNVKNIVDTGTKIIKAVNGVTEAPVDALKGSVGLKK